jgi:hypothetical protein
MLCGGNGVIDFQKNLFKKSVRILGTFPEVKESREWSCPLTSIYWTYTFTPSRAFMVFTRKTVTFYRCVQIFNNHLHFGTTVALSIIILLLILLQDNKIVKQYDQTWFYYPPSETIFSYASDIGIAVSINTILLLMSSSLYSALQKATLNFNVRSVRGIFKYGRANNQWNCGMRERSNTLWFIYSWKCFEWNPVALGLVQRFRSVAASTFKGNAMHTNL